MLGQSVQIDVYFSNVSVVLYLGMDSHVISTKKYIQPCLVCCPGGETFAAGASSGGAGRDCHRAERHRHAGLHAGERQEVSIADILRCT